MKNKAAVFFLLKLIKIPLTILTLYLTARFYGVSIQKDIWLLAFSIIHTLDLALWGPVNETFRTKFVTLKEQDGEETALAKTKSLLVYIFFGCVILVVFSEIFALEISKIIAPNYSQEELMQLTDMIRVVAPWLLLNQIILIGISILNSYDVFFIPEISSFFSQIVNILILIFLTDTLGIYALVISLYISNFGLCFFIFFYIKKKEINLFSSFSLKFDGFKVFFLFSLPFFGSYFFGQLNGATEKIIALNLGEGTVSALDFSKRIPDIIGGILTSVVLSILVPNLTRNFIRKDYSAFESEFTSTYKLGLFLIASVFIFMVGSSYDISKLLYSSKQIGPETVILISQLAIFYSLGILGVFTYVIFGMTMMATNNAKLYVFCGIGAQVLVMSGNFILSKYVGIFAFPISFLIGHILCGIVMYRFYPFDKRSLLLISFRYYCFLITGGFFVYVSKWLLNIEGEIYIIMKNLLFEVFLIIVLGTIFRIRELTEMRLFVCQKIKSFL